MSFTSIRAFKTTWVRKNALARVQVEVRGKKQWERVCEQFWKLKLEPHRDTQRTLTNISRMAARGEREMTSPSLLSY